MLKRPEQIFKLVCLLLAAALALEVARVAARGKPLKNLAIPALPTFASTNATAATNSATAQNAKGTNAAAGTNASASGAKGRNQPGHRAKLTRREPTSRPKQRNRKPIQRRLRSPKGRTRLK